MSKNIIDLKMDEDGTYTPNTKHKNSRTKAVEKSAHNGHNYKTDAVPTGADEFLAGIDSGLDFVDAIKVRALRIIGMRD